MWTSRDARVRALAIAVAFVALAPRPPRVEAQPAPTPAPTPAPIDQAAPQPDSPTSAGPPPEPAPAPVPEVAPEPDAAPPPEIADLPPPPVIPQLRLHGFVSEGGFISTDNDYIGRSSRGTLEFFEAGLNVTTDLSDRLRAGIQLFARSVGNLRDEAPRIDWAFLDYRWSDRLGLRAGVIKMPFGLYNEYVDIDAGRLPILLPQSVYPLRNRDALLSHTGFALHGAYALGGAGAIDYQAWLGILTVPREALDIQGATLDEIDNQYVTGGQLFWQTPLEGLRIGGTFLRTVIDFHLTLDPDIVETLIMAGLVEPDFDGRIRISQDPDTLWVASIEYTRGDWLLAAEYSRWLKYQTSTLPPQLLPTLDEDKERFYGMATVRLSERFEVGGYLSVSHNDVGDRRGRGDQWPESFHAFQRDLAATVRFDVNEHWLWKVEAHLIDGTADLPAFTNPEPERTWGLFLFRTTVAF